jgi:hypothetical protein
VTLDLIFERLWLPLKGISIEKTCIGKFSCTTPITVTQKYGGQLEIVFCHSGVIGDFCAIFKKALKG